MLVNVFGAKCIGIEAMKVTVETDISKGIGIHLVGLADVAVKESLLRTVTAIQSLGYRIPGMKIIINLAPADLHKNGSGYDVPIAIGILAASGQISLKAPQDYILMGELGLDGSLRSVPGSLPIAQMASDLGMKGCILPKDNALEASIIGGVNVYGASSLSEVISILSDDKDYFLVKPDSRLDDMAEEGKVGTDIDFEDIVGQEGAKRGLEIAAAGGHNALMVGSPGSGKSSLAKAFAGILPPMTPTEYLQTSKIYSVAGRGIPAGGGRWSRPFRAPHHSASIPALIGGGSDNISPGEVSLAHNGVLFMDELCEAPKSVVEALRAPLEDRKVVISRLKQKVEYPASFMLLAATNPCPCGYWGEGDRCNCSPGRRQAYISRLSGPLMDRIDIQLWLHSVNPSVIVRKTKAEPSAKVLQRVMKAREIQKKRFADEGIFTNSQMSQKQIDRFCALGDEQIAFLEKIMLKNGFSARACSRILKLARTIADLDGKENIETAHLAEAASYRFLDKKDLF